MYVMSDHHTWMNITRVNGDTKFSRECIRCGVTQKYIEGEWQ